MRRYYALLYPYFTNDTLCRQVNRFVTPKLEMENEVVTSLITNSILNSLSHKNMINEANVGLLPDYYPLWV